MRSWVYSPVTHAVMLGAALAFTPVVLMMNRVPNAISRATNLGVEVGGWEIPLVPMLMAVMLALLVVVARRHVTRVRVLASVGLLSMVLLSHRICDAYADLPFYDIRQNWHYGAFGLLTVLALRAFSGFPTGRRLLYAYLFALCFYAADECAQLFLRSRVSDFNDIAKNGIGSLLALVVYAFIVHDGRILGSSPVRHRRLSSYLDSPRSVLVLLFLFNYVLLFVSSLLPGFEYWAWVIGLTLVLTLSAWAVVHVSQWRAGRVALALAGLVVVVGLGASFLRHRDGHIVHYSPGLIVYKGIPVPLADVIIYPSGLLRPVAKKPFFNNDDREYILSQKPDVVVIATGDDGSGGVGFGAPGSRLSRLVFNPATGRPTQFVLRPSAEAVEDYNRLQQRGTGRVLFIAYQPL